MDYHSTPGLIIEPQTRVVEQGVKWYCDQIVPGFLGELHRESQ